MLIDSYRYRYHKNAIINKDILPLVDIDVLSLLELIPFIAGTIWSLYSLSKNPPFSDYDFIPHDSHVSICLTFIECAW